MQDKQQLEVLFQISRSLVQEKNLGELLQQIVFMTAELLSSKICSLMLLDDKKSELRIRATQSLSLTYRDKGPIKVGQSVSGLVVKEKRPIQVSDVRRDPRYSYPKVAEKEGCVSLLSVPMMFGERAIGVLNCYTAEERVFTNNEIQLVQTVANQAAIAIEYVRVLEDRDEKRLALESKKAVDAAKRILMKKHRMPEEDAHRFLQKSSMERNKSMKEVAEAVLLAENLEK